MTAPHPELREPIENQPAAADEIDYDLTLFVSGASDLSARAIANARHLCVTCLGSRCRLSVVDVFEDPAAVLRNRVIAAPTLVKNRPLPVRRFVGDMSNTGKVLLALDIAVGEDASGTHS